MFTPRSSWCGPANNCTEHNVATFCYTAIRVEKRRSSRNLQISALHEPGFDGAPQTSHECGPFTKLEVGVIR
jgi:hypothetical protein